MRVSEIRVKRIRVNQGLGVLLWPLAPELTANWGITVAMN